MRYAHALVGGGVARSRLAARLAERGHGPIALFDPVDHDPRTLAIFAEPDGGWARDFLVHRWSRVTIRGGGRTVTRHPSHPYAILRAQALRDHAREVVEAAGGTVIRGRVRDVLDGEDHSVVVLADGSHHEAEWVYDSRIEPAADATALRQTFAGVWVETEQPAFDPDEAVLMDFDRFAAEPRGSSAVRFVHTMPTSPHRALITAVEIGPGRPKLPIGTWLPGVLDEPTHTIVSTESGSTPLMTDAPVRRVAPRRLRVGNAGGLLKASTGYAVQRIDDDARAIVAAIDATGAPALPRRRHAVPWRWLDRVFLDLVAQRGQRAHRVLFAMFERRPIDAVVAFLEERATCPAVVGTVLRLPHWDWFALAMGRPLMRRLGARRA